MTGVAFRFLAGNRAALELDLRESWRRKYLSPVLLGLHSQLVPRLLRYARGRFLDVGCGTMPFRRYLDTRVERYDSLDLEARVPGVTFISDLRAMPMVGTNTYDSALCSEVLEHIADPDLALAELFRVMRPSGMLLLSVPFLARLHEEPYDYFRYTCHGLEHLLTGAGFRLVEIVPTGSVCSFLGHQISVLVLSATYRIPVVRDLAFAVNALGVVLPCYWLDRVSGLGSKMPAGYVAVAVKG